MKWLNDYRMRLVLIGVVAAMVFGGGNARADFTWTLRADMPTPRRGVSTSAVNGKIYAIGGASSEPNPELVWPVEVYDPATDTWTRKADMPMARAGSTSVVNGKIYVIGGTYLPNASTSDVEEYDPATDTWTRKADMPTPRRQVATCAVNGKIYAIGGLAGAAVQGLRAVEEYDPSTDTWTRKASISGGLWGLCANVVNGKIYVLGGRPGYTAIPNVQEYDPSTDTWTRKANMPVGTSQMASVVLGDKIVVIGGWRSSGDKVYSTVQMYDPETDIWTMEADAPFLRAAFSASVVNNRIYAIGGTDRIHPCPATSTVYEYGPMIDFNGDGIVDADDMCIIINHWGEDYSLCDIAPPPFGDGIVDVQDLIVLSEHLFEDYRLISHWKLDEIDGDIAYDNAGNNHGNLNGNPIWQPAGGLYDGALELDGNDDYVSTPFVLNPGQESLSAFAWIQGGAPGQVILSQTGDFGGTLLGSNPTEGTLMTGLSDMYFGALVSETVVTDGQWHHVGLVYDLDTLHRRLYVDGAQVAEDATVVSGMPSGGGLNIGASKDLDAGSFFSGLIDDVRIYNQALSADEIATLAQ